MHHSKVLEQSVGSDNSKTIIAEIISSREKHKKSRIVYKVWLPKQDIETNPVSFLSANFPSFSEYLTEKYGDFEMAIGPDRLVKNFPLSIVDYHNYENIIGIALMKNGEKFGHLKIHNWYVGHNLSREEENRIWEEHWEKHKDNPKLHKLWDEICYPKVCSVFKEFSYIPGLKPEIPDSDFFKIMKHEIMNATYCVNYRRNINKRLVLNEEEFIAALDIWVNRNKKRENEHWKTDWRRDDIISKHNEKRVFSNFLWSFWAGWDHGTKMTAYSCENCDDADICRKSEIPKSAYLQNTKDGFYTYEPLEIRIPFP